MKIKSVILPLFAVLLAVSPGVAYAQSSDGALIIFAIFSLIIYFLPSIVANYREIEKQAGVFVVNLFLGWTLIGWVVALTWAVSGEKPKKPDDKTAIADKNRPNISETSKLVRAINEGDINMAKEALDAGANPYAKNKSGLSILSLAKEKGRTEIVELLENETAPKLIKCQDCGKDVSRLAPACPNCGRPMKKESDAKWDTEISAIDRRLINAASFGLCEDVKKSLARGANPNAIDEKGKSALDYAKEKEHSEVVQILKESGAKE